MSVVHLLAPGFFLGLGRGAQALGFGQVGRDLGVARIDRRLDLGDDPTADEEEDREQRHDQPEPLGLVNERKLGNLGHRSRFTVS